MLKTPPHWVLLLCLAAILWPSYGHTMKDEGDKSTLINQNLQSSTIFDVHQTKEPIEKTPRSIKYLIAYCPTRVGSDIDPDTNYQAIVDGSTKARKLLIDKCTEYNNAKKYYSRAMKVYNNEKNEVNEKILYEKLEALEEIQIWFLRKYPSGDNKIESSVTNLIKLNQLLENKKDKKIKDIAVHFPEEIKNIRQIINTPKEEINFKPNEKHNKESKSILIKENNPLIVPGFYIEPHRLEEEHNKIKRLKALFEREASILGEICDAYTTYASDVTGGGLWKFPLWYWDTPRADTENNIKQTIDKEFPYGPYNLRLINEDPLSDSLDSIEERDLFLYSKDNNLYFKVKDKEEMIIFQKNITCTVGLGKGVYGRVISALSEENPHLSAADTLCLLNFSSFCGYLPDDLSTQATLRAIGKARHLLSKLHQKTTTKKQDKESEFEINDEKESDKISVLERKYKTLPKFVDIEEEENNDSDHTPYPILDQEYPHKKDMLSSLNKLHSTVPLVLEVQAELATQFEYNTNSLAEYMKDFDEFKLFFIKHLKFVTPLDTDVGYKVPGALSAYQSEAYREETDFEVLNLASSKLDDDSFFQNEQEKEWQRLQLLFKDPNAEDLKSIQKGELGLFIYSGNFYNTLYCKVYDKAAHRIALSDDPSVTGCSSDVYYRLVEAMDLSSDEAQKTLVQISPSDKDALFRYTSQYGYTQKEYLLSTCKCKKIVLYDNQIVGEKRPTFPSDLEELDIGNNYLTSTRFVTDLTKLKRLDARNNYIDSFDGLTTCKSLTYLNLKRIPIHKSNENSDEKGKISNNIGVDNCYDSVGNRMNMHPLWQLPNLTYLNLAHHDLKATGFLQYSGFNNITHLNVSHNKFTTVAFFDELDSLKYLNISHNGITDLAPLAQLVKLEEVKANDNLLKGCVTTYFPQKLKGHYRLRSLDISSNPAVRFCPSNDSDLEAKDFKHFFPMLHSLRLDIAKSPKEFTWEWAEEPVYVVENKDDDEF